MIQLFMDTSYKTMTIACIVDDKIASFYHDYAFKTQSELAMTTLDKVMKKAGLRPNQIEEMIITIGPGSYTGVRIAMTIAKTLATISDIRVKTITSLELFCANDENTLVVFDARSDRAYIGLFENKQYVKGPVVLTIPEINNLIKHLQPTIVGDAQLFEGVENFELTEEMLLDAIKKATLVSNVHQLKPLYLKEMSAY